MLDGNNDHVTGDGDFVKNTISLGNGNNDCVIASGLASTDGQFPISTPDVGANTITLGNGKNDTVILVGSIAGNGGDDVINTGTGANDQINIVGSRHFADTFGFALGTSDKNFTTVTGALGGDLVDVNGGTLGKYKSFDVGHNDGHDLGVLYLSCAVVL
jgi:hypothetical protein